MSGPEVRRQDEARVGRRNGTTRRWVKRGGRPAVSGDRRTIRARIFNVICRMMQPNSSCHAPTHASSTPVPKGSPGSSSPHGNSHDGFRWVFVDVDVRFELWGGGVSNAAWGGAGDRCASLLDKRLGRNADTGCAGSVLRRIRCFSCGIRPFVAPASSVGGPGRCTAGSFRWRVSGGRGR